MPDLELQIEETAVQLTQKDLDILSAYSWDMTGYTSRFGFFYFGNENADVEGLTKWQAEHIFQLRPVPPGMEDELQNMEKTKRINKEKKREILKKNEAVGDAYLTRAVEEKNLLFLSFFLHAYESRINRRVYSFLRRNGMDTYNPALFLDMKLALQEVLLKKLPTYDPNKGAKFLTYMYEFIEDAFLSFRMREECWTISSLDIYKGIRRIAAIYNANAQNEQKTIKQFCEATGCKRKTAESYLLEAVGIRARQAEVIVDWDENEIEIIEDIIPSRVGDLCSVLWNHWKLKAVRESFEKLSWRDRMILQARNAICHHCGGMQPMKERYTFLELSNLIGIGTDDGAEKAYHASLDRFTAQMAADNVIHVVDLVLEKKEKAAAIYRYQADCDSEWGEICFDFESKRVQIRKLAEWDTTKSHLYAKKAICFIALSKELPEEKRIVFTRK